MSCWTMHHCDGDCPGPLTGLSLALGRLARLDPPVLSLIDEELFLSQKEGFVAFRDQSA
jgi:hypothetical protein